MSRPTDYTRRSARTVLRDPAGRVLLVRSRFRREITGLSWAWFVPGGGVEPGEAIRAAAVREIAEETGIVVSEPELTHLAFAEGHGQVGEITGPMRDDIFLTDVGEVTVSTAAMEEHERSAFGEYRWWDLAALTATDDLVFPVHLARALADFTADAWDQPRHLPW